MNNSSFKVYNASAGSGKTFTLVKEYLKILLLTQSNFTFQNILAITFTNKAAAEMKERILTALRSFSEGVHDALLEIFVVETKLPPALIQQKSTKILQNILQNYAAFNITTIDSFTHKLIRTFAYDLGLPLNFEVEMDGKKLLSEAVDLLISRIGEKKELTDLLIDFSFQKIAEDTSWDFTKKITEVALLLLNEDDTKELGKVGPKTIEDFKQVKIKLLKEKKNIENEFSELAAAVLQLIDNSGVNRKDFYHADYPNYFIRISAVSSIKITSLIEPSKRLKENMEKEVFYSKSASKFSATAIDSIAVELKEFYWKSQKLIQEKYGNYLLIKLVLKNLIPMATLHYIKEELEGIKTQNSICLSSEFNTIISAQIKNEPAPFIYERIGEKFTHFFIDEMQDTSSLQWENLIPLIGNSLAQEGASLMLVGDAKQAIYRWRGGKAEQFINLSSTDKTSENNPFFIPKKVENLPVNFRSFSELIEFNNNFFTFIAEILQKPVYKDMYLIGNRQKQNHNKGGYVQIDFVAKQETVTETKELFAEKTYEVIQNLDATFKKSDICIIVRTKAEGVAIANFLAERGIAIVSSETLLLQNSAKVNFIVAVLQYINNPQDDHAKFAIAKFVFEKQNLTSKAAHDFYANLVNLSPSLFFEKISDLHLQAFHMMPFYECVEYLIRAFELTLESDAYLQFFMDYVLDFQRKKHHDIGAFLDDWSLKKDSLSIAAAANDEAVQIMTIHKSKGLEFPVVIFPSDVFIDSEKNAVVWYDDFDTDIFGDLGNFQISLNKDFEMINDHAASVYSERTSVVRLDNFNLLYVALTRAVEQLYLISSHVEDPEKIKSNSFASLYARYLNAQPNTQPWDTEKQTFSFGEKHRQSSVETLKESLIEEQQTYISGAWENHDIKIVSNASKVWGDERQKAIDYGLLVHEMFSKIKIKNDIKKVVKQYLVTGVVLPFEARDIQKSIELVMAHPALKPYFKEGLKVLTEQEIVDENKNVYIPDRLVFKGSKVVIIDFKTGKKESKHKKQILSYKTVLEKMKYQVDKCILVYLGAYVTVEVV